MIKTCSSYSGSFLVLYILADLISFLEIQSLQLAGSSSTVFAVNLILYYWLKDYLFCRLNPNPESEEDLRENTSKVAAKIWYNNHITVEF